MKVSIKNTLIAMPVLWSFFIMGFVDFVGISTDYAQEAFHWSPIVTGFIPSLVFVWFLFLGIPVGSIMNKWGRKNTVLVSMVITIIGMFLPLISFNGFTCMVAYIFLGIGNAILQVSLNPLITNVIREEKLLASSMTAGQVIKAVSALLGPEFIMFAVGLWGHDGWYYCFPLIGAVTLLTAIWLVLTPIQREESEFSDIKSSLVDAFKLLKDKAILILFLCILFVVGIDVATNFISSKVMTQRFSWTAEEAKTAPQIYFFCRTVGALLGTFLLTKISGIKYFKVNIFACAIALLIWALVPVETVNVICIGAVGFLASSIFPIVYSIALQTAPNKANQISGLMITAVAGGGVVTPLIGLSDYLAGISGGIWVTFICVLFLNYCAFFAIKKA